MPDADNPARLFAERLADEIERLRDARDKAIAFADQVNTTNALSRFCNANVSAIIQSLRASSPTVGNGTELDVNVRSLLKWLDRECYADFAMTVRSLTAALAEAESNLSEAREHLAEMHQKAVDALLDKDAAESRAKALEGERDAAETLLQMTEGHCQVLGETGPAHAIEGKNLRVRVQQLLKGRGLSALIPRGFATLTQSPETTETGNNPATQESHDGR